MTDDFVDALQREMIRIELLIADIPSLIRKRQLLAAALREYGIPTLALDAPKQIANSIEDVADTDTTPAEPEPDPPTDQTFIALESAAEGDLVRVRPSDAPEPAKPTTEPRKPNIRGDNSMPRPEGIPTTFVMVATILKQTPGLTSREVVAHIREHWWPGLEFARVGPEFSTWIRKGRLDRNDDGKLTVTSLGCRLAFSDFVVSEPEQPHVLPKEPCHAPMPAVRPTAGPRPPDRPSKPRDVVTPGAKPGPPARQEGVKFQHGDHVAILHMREATIALQLRAAMGKGHLDAKLLANSIGIKSDAEITVRDLVDILNPKIAPLGLTIDFYKGFGFVMKEV